MKLLFLHPHQPSQFRLPAIAFASDPGNEVVMLSQKNLEVPLPGAQVLGFGGRVPEGERTHPVARKLNAACHRASDVVRACMGLKQRGFVPDVIVAHSGWGDGMFLRSIFPDVPQLAYMEFWFRPRGGDLGFNPAQVPGPPLLSARTMDNAIHATNFFNADWCLTPTWWQKSVHPRDMHARMSVLHEGIDTELVAPREGLCFELPDGRVLDPGRDEIVTHVERHFDRYRGFPTFLEAIDLIQRRRPKAHVVVVGKEGNGYTGAPAGTFAEMIRQAPFDRARTHFVGHLSYEKFLRLLQVSSAHVYLTAPFVLSWSFLEAMSAGCAIACSDTAPVREVAEDGRHCLMFDFLDAQALADRVDTLLDDRALAARLGAAARQRVIEQYDVRELQPRMVQLIRDVAAHGKPQSGPDSIAAWNRRWGREDPQWQSAVGLFQPTLPEAP
jgi:glycosyltransferase involved in cell wall biosynthesis